MYLKIQNSGEVDVRAFTKLGVSTSRDSTDKIGQFGSGAKHGILVLLRHGLYPIIYSGNTEITYFTQPNKIGEAAYNDTFIKIGDKTVELPFSLEYGSIDWTDISMGLRELVSNAIDSGDIDIEIVEECSPVSGTTRIFVPLNNEVQYFCNTLPRRFLHFSNRPLDQVVLDKQEVGPAEIYRKGVFIRKLRKHSMFDYNFGDELKIDECRNSSDWDCKEAIAKTFSSNRMAMQALFTRFAKKDYTPLLEYELSSFYLVPEDWWLPLWKRIVGENTAIILDEDSFFTGFIIKKGLRPIAVPEPWYNVLGKVLPRGCDVLANYETKGYEKVALLPRVEEIFDEVWGILSDLNMTNGKSKPKINCFSQVVEKDTVLGYCDGNNIYINVDFVECQQTYFEECAHYITGCADGTRSFQDFAFQLVTRLVY